MSAAGGTGVPGADGRGAGARDAGARVPDVLVIGAGIVGAACARALAVAGATVTVLDRGSAAGGTTSHGEGNILVSDKLPGPELDLARRSIELWPLLARELDGAPRASGAGGASVGGAPRRRMPSIEFDAKGGLVVATTESGEHGLERFAQTQRRAGIDARPLTASEARECEPWLTDEVTAAVHYPQDAQVQPVIAAEAMLADVRARGGRVIPGTEVLGARRGADARILGVETTAGYLAAGTVVLAAGPWSGEVATRLGASIPVLPRRGLLLVTARMPPRVFRKVYDADYVGAVESDDAALQVSTVVESTASGTILIGSSRQRVGFEERLDVEVLSQLAERALRIFPFLRDLPVMRTYGGFRPYLPDHLPVIGADPDVPGLFHATGHEGAGVGLAPATGELIRDLVLGRRGAIDPQPFRLDRASLAPFRESVAAA